MIPIILGVLIIGMGTAWRMNVIARRDVKKQQKNSLGASWIGLILAYGVVFAGIGGFAGWWISFIFLPIQQVEESNVVTTLLPFPKNNETDPTIYAIQEYRSVRIRYDDGTVKIGLCCDERTPKIIEEEGDPSIRKYRREKYLGWFSVRFASTWYELRVPSNSVIPEYLAYNEILR